MFDSKNVNLEVLRKRAYNLRWATVPSDVIPLTAADPDFPCASEIVDAIAEYCKSGYFSYSPAEGIYEFKESLHNFFLNKRSFNVAPDQILPVDSAAFGIHLVCKTILRPGDEAIIFDPVDFLFQFSIEDVGAIPVRYSIPPGKDLVDFNELESIISKKTKLICLCNPLNPTGKVFKTEELITLAHIAKKYNLIILSDEIWSDIVFSPHIYRSIASLSDEISQSVITVTGFSKSYGLAGLRIGAVATANTALFRKLLDFSLHHFTIHGANSIAQIAGIAALNKSQYWLNGFLSHLSTMRNLLSNRINSIKGLSTIAPEGCYVCFVNIKDTGMTSEAFRQKLLKEAKVAVVPGLSRWFGPGAEGFIRISFATSEEILDEALNRIENIL